MPEPLSWWVSEWERLGREGFAAAGHDVPVLLLMSRTEPAQEDATDRQKFMTIRIGKSTHVRADPLDLLVHPVKKAEGRNVFGMMITIGRAQNNDIVIDASSVSKFHGYLEQREGRWHLRDANSSNGTFVGGQQVQGDASVPLSDSTDLRFARVTCRFLLPESFFRVLEKEAARRKRDA